MLMALTNLLAPVPFWVAVKANGTAAGGAYLYTWSSLNYPAEKPVYRDAGFSSAWTNPIIFQANGVQGPFYWTVDSLNPDDTYFLQLYDGDKDVDGNLLFEVNNYSPPGSGGGGDSTTYLPLRNYIANNQLIDHIDSIVGTPSLPANLVIAPSNHKGFTPALINPVSATPYGVVGPDIRFIKAGGMPTANTDRITFTNFVLGDNSFSPDVTPVDYITYRCDTSNTGEDYKYFQFPITQKVQNLSGQQMSFVLWAKVTTTPEIIRFGVLQFFGNGTGASSPVLTYLDSRTLTTSWAQYVVTINIPTVATKTLATVATDQTNDDAIYAVIGLPLNEPCEISFCKPALYLGQINLPKDFDDYDQINSINSTPRTGDIKVTYVSNPAATAADLTLKGWVPMNDGSIGKVGSNATTRENNDTFQLYKTIWDSVSNTWAPVQESGGTFPLTRGATAIADFLANRRLNLPRSLGRALAGAGTGEGLTARVLGEYVGSEVISEDAMPAHTHPPLSPSNTFIMGQPSGGTFAAPGSGPTLIARANTGSTGGSAADGNMEPTSFMEIYLKL